MNGRSDLGCYMCEIFQFSFWRRPGRYLLGGGVISASVTKEGIKAEEVWLFELSCVFPYADYALSILGFHLWLVRSINISRISCETLQRDRRCKVTCQVSVNLTHKRSDQILMIPLRETLNCEVCGERLRIEGELPGVTYCQVEVQSLTMLYCVFVSQTNSN